MIIQVWVSGIRWLLDLMGLDTGTIFYLWVTTIPDLNRDRYGWVFFLPMGNLIGTRYFTTVMILGCEQVKMCLFYDIDYDLF
jgi:hypothetical protein